MHISGTLSSSVILGQTLEFKRDEKRYLKVPKQAEANIVVVINRKINLRI